MWCFRKKFKDLNETDRRVRFREVRKIFARKPTYLYVAPNGSIRVDLEKYFRSPAGKRALERNKFDFK